MAAPGMIEIPFEEYDRLVDSENFLEALNQAGVDNWEGYDVAYQIYNGQDPDSL